MISHILTFFFGYLKSKIYADNPSMIPDLEDNITRDINAIPGEMLEQAIKNWTPVNGHLEA